MALFFVRGRVAGTAMLVGGAVTGIVFGIGVSAAPPVKADPPYQSCDEARADGRWSIPYTDPAYQPELDLDGDGLACEPGKAHRSRR